MEERAQAGRDTFGHCQQPADEASCFGKVIVAQPREWHTGEFYQEMTNFYASPSR